MGCGAAPIGSISHTVFAGFAAAARQIAGQATLLRLSAEADRAAIRDLFLAEGL
jgi:hypothetical protein